MKVLLVLLFCIVAVLAFEEPREFHQGIQPDQPVNPPDWVGSWTSRNRYGGATYTCTKGNQLYGMYSNAGFFVGTITDRTVVGNWYEGGRGNRNNYQGSFRITISDDNQEFDGFFNRMSDVATVETRWHESRLGAPFPSNPTADQCFMPDSTAESISGAYYRSPETGLEGNFAICKDEWDQVYGSFYLPEGYFAGWSVEDFTGFHGYSYDSYGTSGAYILRSITQEKVTGFYWRGRLAIQNQSTSKIETLVRTSFRSSLTQCEQVGPGFTERLKGPNFEPYYVNSAATISTSLFVVLGAFLAFFF